MIYQVEIQNVHFQLGFDDEIVERAKEYAEAWKDRIAKINRQLSKTNPVFKSCVGTSDARHSMVWKIWSRTGDIYISNRSGNELILQQSGQCKSSVSRNEPTTEPNEELLWQRPNPTGTSAAHVFQIIIPESELRGDKYRKHQQCTVDSRAGSGPCHLHRVLLDTAVRYPGRRVVSYEARILFNFLIQSVGSSCTKNQ